MKGREQPIQGPYQLKVGTLSSHGQIVTELGRFGLSCRILDVGTATGYLGAVLRQRGFHSLTGIERNPAWAAEARTHYGSVAEVDIEQNPLPWQPGSFDALVCADVLEHTRHPEQILQRLLPMVNQKGWVIVSLPNVAHWSVRLSLLLGRFEYADSGILDRDHVRFFTRASARRLLRRAGLVIRRVKPTPLPIARWCATMPQLSLLWRIAERADWLLGCLWPGLFAYQFVFIAQKMGDQPTSSND